MNFWSNLYYRYRRFAKAFKLYLILTGPGIIVMMADNDAGGITTYTVTGHDLQPLQTELEGKPGVDMVAPFGTSLHVSGRDRGALEATIAPYRERPGSHWQHSEPSLEDVFIELMTRSKDNFQ